MLTAAQDLNLAVRFGLELGLLAVVAVASWRGVRSRAARLAAVVLVPGAVAVGWVLLVHGASVPQPVQTGAQLGALALGLLAFRRLGARLPATAAVAALAIGNAVLLAVWNQ
ncbi:Protein of unknown function [Geodermatophilus saharensis]|uniref:Uncharacterized protein n=1 Tax=Geodermatophilus saharensis TaxID=1137994 RepID=A0A239A494_9ACTN|nr:DUF2568 domain-containing protein [Geodermatophilus saharensis]SNR90477.1 Protein of unknown function [Geodermatophilus saharensis]